MSDKEAGLSSGNRNFIVFIFTVALLLLGPIEPYGMIVRFSYIIVLPILLWYGLEYFGNKWKMDQLANDRLSRGIFGVIAGVFFVAAYLSYTADYHSECTQEVRSRDGSECVGDYVAVKGPDNFSVLMMIGLGVAAAWYAISEHKQEL